MKFLILPLLIATKYLDIKDPAWPNGPEIIFNITMKNETFLPSNKSEKFEIRSQYELTSQMKCLYKDGIETLVSTAWLYCHLENTKQSLNLYHTSALPSSTDQFVEFGDQPHVLDGKIFEIQFRPYGILSMAVTNSLPTNDFFLLDEIVNQLHSGPSRAISPTSEKAETFQFGKCQTYYNVSMFNGTEELFIQPWQSDLTIVINKERDMRRCWDHEDYTPNYEKIINFDYARSKMISNISQFISSTETVVDTKESFPELDKQIEMKTRVNVTVTFDSIVPAANKVSKSDYRINADLNDLEKDDYLFGDELFKSPVSNTKTSYRLKVQPFGF